MIGVRTQALHCITAVQGAHGTSPVCMCSVRAGAGAGPSCLVSRVSRALRSRRAFGADLKLSCSIYMYQKCRTRVLAMRLWRARPAPARTRRPGERRRITVVTTHACSTPFACTCLMPYTYSNRRALPFVHATRRQHTRRGKIAAQKFIMDAKSKPDVRSNSSAA